MHEGKRQFGKMDGLLYLCLSEKQINNSFMKTEDYEREEKKEYT